MLALSFKLPLTSINNIKGFLEEASDEELILDFLTLIDEGINKETSMLLIASFKRFLQIILTESSSKVNESQILIAYKIFLLSKKNTIELNLQKMFLEEINLEKSLADLIESHKGKMIEKSHVYEHTLVFLRILTLVQIPKHLKKALTDLMNVSLQEYYEVLKGYFEQSATAT